MNIWLNNYEKTSYNWNIVLKETNQSIGNISVINSNNIKETEIAYLYYCIGSKYWRQGYGTEALTKIIDFLINEVGLKQITAGCDSLNVASLKTMEKSGMTKIKIIKNMGLNPETGEYTEDRVEMGIIK